MTARTRAAAWGVGMALLFAWVAAAGADDTTPKWLADAKARESRLSEPTDIVSEDGRLRAKVPGVVRHKVVLEDDTYNLNFTLEGDTTVSCEVLRGSQDLADFLSKTVEISFEALQKANGTIEVRALEASDAGAVGPHPFLSLQWLYRANQKGEKRVGALKQYLAALDDVVVYCAHDELGYANTFEKVTRGLTASLRTAGEPAMPPYFREVSVASVDGARVGVAVTTISKDNDGDSKLVNKMAMLLQAAPGKLVSQDMTEVQWIRPGGSLINAALSKVSNGKLSQDTSLKRQDDERWHASGTLDGKSVEFDLPGEPSSFVALAKGRRQLMARPDPAGASTDALAWSTADLTKLLPARTTVLAPAGAERFAAREELGGVSMEVVLDKLTGTEASAKILLGPRTLTMERIYRQGEF